MFVSALNAILKDGLSVADADEVQVQVFFRLQRVSLMITLFVLIRLFGLKVPLSYGLVMVALSANI